MPGASTTTARRDGSDPSRRAPARRASDSRAGKPVAQTTVRIAAEIETEARRCIDARRPRTLARTPVRASRAARSTHRCVRAVASSSDPPSRSDCATIRRIAPCRRSMPTRRPTSCTPRSLQRVQIEVRPLRRADQLRRRHATRSHDVVDCVVALVEDAERVHPPLDVAAAIRPRQPDVLADGEPHVAPGTDDLVGELHTGRRRTDDQHAARIELIRIAIIRSRSPMRSTRAVSAASAGIAGQLHAPLASTTAAHHHSPRSVTTR